MFFFGRWTTLSWRVSIRNNVGVPKHLLKRTQLFTTTYYHLHSHSPQSQTQTSQINSCFLSISSVIFFQPVSQDNNLKRRCAIMQNLVRTLFCSRVNSISASAAWICELSWWAQDLINFCYFLVSLQHYFGKKRSFKAMPLGLVHIQDKS